MTIREAQSTDSDAGGVNYDSRHVGLAVNLTGVVTGTLSDGTGFFMQENASIWGGIRVSTSYCEYDFGCASDGGLPSVSYSIPENTGYEVRVLGTLFELNGTTTLGSVSAIKIINTDATLPAALNVTTGMLGGTGSYLSEAYEGVLVQLTRGATFGKDEGYATHIPVDDGSGDLELATSCLDFNLAVLRAFYGETSLNQEAHTERHTCKIPELGRGDRAWDRGAAVLCRDG